MKRATLTIFLLLLASCAAQQPAPAPEVRVIDTACQWTRLITASKDDTADTKRQILAHDQAWIANCQKAASIRQD